MRLGLEVREYLDAEGHSPFREWLNSLEVPARARVQARILRFETGNLGDHRGVGGGVFEARLTHGPGYRIYFGRLSGSVVLLLLGGTKARQGRDVSRARAYWKTYRQGGPSGQT